MVALAAAAGAAAAGGGLAGLAAAAAAHTSTTTNLIEEHPCSPVIIRPRTWGLNGVHGVGKQRSDVRGNGLVATTSTTTTAYTAAAVLLPKPMLLVELLMLRGLALLQKPWPLRLQLRL